MKVLAMHRPGWRNGQTQRDLKSTYVPFVATRQNPARAWFGVQDPFANEETFTFPGKTDAGYRDNVWLIYREIEGK